MMPRKAKSFHAQRREAATLWRKGKRTEANELWNKAASSMLARQESKRNKKAAK